MADAAPADLFPTDEPLAPGQLIGRGTDVTEIAAQLELGANVILAEPRRTGKTTVADAVLAALGKRGLYTVNLDLWAVADIDEMAEQLIEKTIANRPALRKALFAARRGGRSFYEHISMTVGAKMATTGEFEGLDLTILPRLRHDPVRYLDYALALPERIAAADGRRLVLFVDEFQNVDKIGENHERGWSEPLKRKMRSVFQRAPHVSFLFAGSLEHMMVSIFGRSDEAFFNFGSFHELGPILPEEWRSGLTRRFRRAELEADIEAIDLMVERGEGHPRSVMLLAQQSYVIARLAGTDTISAGIAEAAYLEALRSERSRHQAYVERIQQLRSPAVNRIALKTIVRIARGQPPYAGKSRAPSGVQRVLDALEDAGFIEHDSEQRGWQVVDPLFAAYLAALDIRADA